MNRINRPSIDQQVVFLYCSSLDRASAFYGELLQLPLVLDQGSCRIYRSSPSSFIGVCESGAPSGQGKVILTLVTQEVDGWYAYLQAQEVAIEKPPTVNHEFNIYHLFLRDPDGYLIEIQQFLDPAWPL